MDNQKDPDVRWKQRFSSFRRAFRQLQAAAQLAEVRPLTELEQQGLIQAFEFTHELAWNVMKDYLMAHGATTRMYGSRDATREAVATELIANGDDWMAMIRSRNLTTHTYNEDTAEEIVDSVLNCYALLFEKFESNMSERERSEP